MSKEGLFHGCNSVAVKVQFKAVTEVAEVSEAGISKPF